MVIYSRWDPSSGLYEYFEAPQRPGMNDDLPIPALPRSTEIGVPSTECGRPMPSGARAAGSGEMPVGLITPPSGVQTLAGGLPGMDGRFNGWWLAATFLAGAAVWATMGTRIRRVWTR